MLKRNMIFVMSAVAVLANCSSAVQTSSGRDYNQSVPLGEKGIREAASVEPILKFPANFCIAKTSQTKMVYSEPAEMAVWQNLASRHADWGTFREVNPAVVNLVVSEGGGRWRDTEAGANDIRLGAARQHCDAVLTYEVRKGAGGAAATGLLYDVRNGYTYITANETGKNTTDAVSKLASSVESAMSALSRALD